MSRKFQRRFLFQVWKSMRNDRTELGMTHLPPDIDSIRPTYRARIVHFVHFARYSNRAFPVATLQRIIYVCRVIVWSHTVSLFPKEGRPLLESFRNCRPDPALSNGFPDRSAKRHVKLDFTRERELSRVTVSRACTPRRCVQDYYN